MFLQTATIDNSTTHQFDPPITQGRGTDKSMHSWRNCSSSTEYHIVKVKRSSRVTYMTSFTVVWTQTYVHMSEIDWFTAEEKPTTTDTRAHKECEQYDSQTKGDRIFDFVVQSRSSSSTDGWENYAQTRKFASSFLHIFLLLFLTPRRPTAIIENVFFRLPDISFISLI